MVKLFDLVLYQPLLNLLVLFYNFIPDAGVAIILITILIRLLLFPLTIKTYQSQRALQSLQPQVKEIQNRLKNNPQELTKTLMALYQKEKINPLSSCFPLLLQLPVLIAIYQVFQTGLDATKTLPHLYSFIHNPGHLSPYFLSFVNLSTPSIALAALAGIAQYFQSKMLPVTPPPSGVPGSKDEKMTAMMNKQMLYLMPLFTIFIGASLPAGLTFYWLLTTLLTILQQWYFLKPKPLSQQ